MGGLSQRPESTSPHAAAFDDGIFHERYLLGRLDPEEVERFERHYLDCPECLERLETTQTLLDTLRQTAVQDATQRLQVGFLALLWHRLQRMPRPLVAMASVVLVMLGGWGTWRLVDQGRQLTDLSARLSALQASAQSPLQIALAPLRGGPTDTPQNRRHLSLPPTPQWLSLELDLGLAPGAAFDVSYKMAGDTLWQRRGLRADAAGKIDLLLLSEALPAGQGELQVHPGSPSSGDGVVARFPLQVQLQVQVAAP